jgi:CMP-N-acetylneuraminic acid synthetase
MKAHSERVPGKNFRSIAGKPLFFWVLDTLFAVPQIDKVVINSDARQQLIDAGLVETDRVQIRDRKSTLCGDLVSMNSIIADDLGAVEADIYLMTHTTNPLLSSGTISKALEVFVEQSVCDSLFSVNKWQTRLYRADGTAINHDPQELVRTQDLEAMYEENSNIYLFSRDCFERTNARIGERPMLFEMSKHESIDIDDPDDWLLAEALLNHKILEPGVV